MMKLRAKHLRHPFRTLAKATVKAKTYFDVKSFPYRSRLRFRGDPRYQLQNVTRGLESRIETCSDDGELLQRICAAYIKAVEHQETAGETYRPTKWWQEQQTRLQPVMRALKNRDIPALRHMYGNFYRDPCSTGLVPMTGMPWAVPPGKFTNIDRHFHLAASLCAIDYWKERTGGRFAISDLAGPNIGNPFGTMVDGTLVRGEAGSEFPNSDSRKTDYRSCRFRDCPAQRSRHSTEARRTLHGASNSPSRLLFRYCC